MLSQALRLIDYDHDPDRPGRPLLVLLGGAAVACLALFLLFVLAFRTWVTHEVDPAMAYWGIGLLFCFYILGVYVFSYAFMLYDLEKALRLTLFVAVFSVAAIVVIVSALAVLAKVEGAAKAYLGSDSTGPANEVLSMLPVVGSYIGAGDDSGGDSEDDLPSAGRPFTIGCQSCGERFTPAPPDAACPFCGRAALAVSR